MAIAIQRNKRRYKGTVTVVAGAPIFLADVSTFADRLLILMAPGATGAGKVYDDVPDIAGVRATPAQVAGGADTAIPLAPAPADGISPGGVYTDTAAPNGSIDLSGIALDGTHTGDQILFDAHLKI
jgi:hypothetical protein